MGHYSTEPADRTEPEELGFIVTYDGDTVSEEPFNRMECAVKFAKEYTKDLAITDEMNFEKVAIELVYETDEDGELVWDNDLLKFVEYDSHRNDWDVKSCN